MNDDDFTTYSLRLENVNRLLTRLGEKQAGDGLTEDDIECVGDAADIVSEVAEYLAKLGRAPYRKAKRSPS